LFQPSRRLHQCDSLLRPSTGRGAHLAPDLAGAIALAGIDPLLESRPLQDAIRVAIATSRVYCSWDVDTASWVVTRYHPERQAFYGPTPEEALAAHLIHMMTTEIGVDQFMV
jgi:hypothetical protein